MNTNRHDCFFLRTYIRANSCSFVVKERKVEHTMITFRNVIHSLILLGFWGATCFAVETDSIEDKKKPEAPKPQQIELAEGKLVLLVPGDWKQVKPRSRIIQFEFQVPAAKPVESNIAKEDDSKQVSSSKSPQPGRMTIMNAGGGVKANIDRWVGQFRTAEGKPLDKEKQKIGEKKLSELTVHTVDLVGTFLDKPRGPFGPSVERPNYRMLAAIVPTKKHGMWFIKYYGPRESVDSQAESFAKMIDAVEWKEQAARGNE